MLNAKIKSLKAALHGAAFDGKRKLLLSRTHRSAKPNFKLIKTQAVKLFTQC